MALGPRLLGGGEATAVAEQEFGEAVPGTQEIGADVLTTPQQIARGFFLLGRDVNRGEGASTKEDRELARIATIGFDAVAGPAWNQGGRDDVTRHAVGGERAV